MNVRCAPLLLIAAVIAASPLLAKDEVVAADDAGVVADDERDGGVAEVSVPMTPVPPEYLDDSLTQPITTMGDVIITFLKAMAALAAVLALAWLTLGKGIPKLVEKAQAGKRVKVIERIALDARRSLFLVDIDGRLMVLGGGDVVKLYDLTEGRAGDKPGRFAEVLSKTPPSAPPLSEKT